MVPHPHNEVPCLAVIHRILRVFPLAAAFVLYIGRNIRPLVLSIRALPTAGAVIPPIVLVLMDR